MTTVTIQTIEDAVKYIEDWKGKSDEAPDFELAGDLAKFTAVIEGPRYHGTVPADLARGLWEFQLELYRAAAFAIYGVDNAIKLTAEQKESLQLVFEIKEGSTDIFAGLGEFLANLGKGIGDGFGSMTSTDKKITLITVAIVIALAYTGDTYLDAQATTSATQAQSAQVVDLEKERTRQFEILAGAVSGSPIVNRFKEATAEGVKEIIKGAPDADSIKIGEQTYSKAEIKEMNQRAAKEPTAGKIITEQFQILSIEPRETATTKVWLGMKDAEFPIVIVHDEIDADAQQKVWAAAKERKLITLEVSVIIVRGKIKSGHLSRVP